MVWKSASVEVGHNSKLLVRCFSIVSIIRGNCHNLRKSQLSSYTLIGRRTLSPLRNREGAAGALTTLPARSLPLIQGRFGSPNPKSLPRNQQAFLNMILFLTVPSSRLDSIPPHRPPPTFLCHFLLWEQDASSYVHISASVHAEGEHPVLPHQTL